ncbi:BglG family transcription antiterminator [Pectinatus sottacetonis]|uniref:BglG family transcription antiterminator n=1 Tax=Pectinatus sottacetonis TaxID=1002795 RepID=UPI0018C47775|nr:BglG family transcription antiterminator [Pectinatus sottacetonis]
MNRASKLILQILLKAIEPVTGAELAAQAGCSERSVRNYMKTLQSILADYNAHVNAVPHSGYMLDADENTMEVLQKVFFQDRLWDMGADITLLLDKLIENVLCDKWIIQIKLAEETYMSVSTLKQQLKTAGKILREYNLKICSSVKGVKIEGEEKQLRRFLFEYCHDNKKSSAAVFLFRNIDCGRLDMIIQKSLSSHSIKLTDKAVKEIQLHIVMAIQRSKLQCDLFYTISEIKNFIERVEYSIARDIAFSLYDNMQINLSGNEIYYIAQHLIASKKFFANIDKVSKKYVGGMVKRILMRLKKEFAIDFTADDCLADGLALHLQVALSRMKFHMQVKNELLENIKAEYPLAFRLAIAAGSVIREMESITADEDEIGYIAIHFGAALSRKGIHQSKLPKKVIIACDSGMGVAILLRSKLKERFGESIDVEKTIPGYDISDELLCNVDYVITTEPLTNINGKKVICLHNLCNEEDLQRIETKMFQSDVIESMHLNTLFRPEWFFVEELPDKVAVLKFLTKKLMESGYMTKNTRDSVFAREKISSTEIGNLVALPHPLVNGQKNSAIAILVLTKPIQWDDNMVQVIFLINIEKSLLYLWNTIAVKLYDYLVKNNEVKNLLREQSFTKFFDSFVKMFN